MSDKEELLPPLESMLDTSYETSSLVHYPSAYLTYGNANIQGAYLAASRHAKEALHCLEMVHTEVNAIEGKELQNVELGQFRGAIYRALGAVQNLYELDNNQLIKDSDISAALAILQDLKKEHLIVGRLLLRHGFEQITREMLESRGTVER